MRFPAYWARATTEDVDGFGKPVRAACWRWSETSQQAAHDAAQLAARQLLTRLIAGEPLDRYGYGNRPMREEVKQTFPGKGGHAAAVITQNAYGSLVLNTARVLFVDVDFPQASAGEQVGHFFKKWFNKASRPPDEVAQEQAQAMVREFVGRRPGWGARLYRTHSGLRVLATHDVFDPASEATQAVFSSLAADPLYVRLCRAQECFRARLTPKPWRCGHTANVIAWPRESDDARRCFDTWQARYLKKQAAYGTCRHLETLGTGAIHPDVQPIIDVHDEVTRSGDVLPLA